MNEIEIDHKLEYQNAINIQVQNIKIGKLIDHINLNYEKALKTKKIDMAEIGGAIGLLQAQNLLIESLSQVVLAYSSIALQETEDIQFD